MSVSYNNIVPWGRSLQEYVNMFNLSQEDFGRDILGCGDGPASFNTEMNQQGYKITSVDPLYAYSKEQIEERLNITFGTVLEQTRANKDKFLWDHFKSPEALGQARMKTMERFLKDYPKGLDEKRYINAELPNLPFCDKAFDLVLVSHFLFLYSNNLSEDFHRKAIKELCRVGKEIRIFPLVDLNAHPSPYLNKICQELAPSGWVYSLEKANYEFQRGGNQYLQLKSK